MLEIGEKVRYLNEDGEATILHILNNKTALVQDEHGFEHHHPIDQLVPATRDRVSKKDTPVSVPKVEKKPTPKPLAKVVKQNTLPALALAFVSSKKDKPETGDLELVFVNSSNYNLLINISAKNGEEWFSLYHGEVKADAQQSVLSFRRQDVGQVGNLVVDVLFYRNAGYALREALTCTLKIKSTRFVKSGNYCAYQELSNPAIVIPIENNKSETASISVSKSQFSKPKTILKPALPTFEEEVDLHLEMLTADHKVLEDHEKLRLQLRHFEEKLNYAIRNNYIQITFIHGVGKGKLKAEIRSILKEYDLRCEDGPYQKYGVGATVVLLN